MHLLDTNIVSELRRPDRVPAFVREWVERLDPNETFLSAITILEIQRGIARAERHDQAQAAVLNSWLRFGLLPRFEGRILSVDVEVARACARLHVPDPKPELDALIAATALVHRLTVVTRNVVDFGAMSVPFVNPWSESQPH